MTGPRLDTSAGITLSQIEQHFSMDRGGTDQNLRFQDGKGVYTSGKASLAGVKAFFGFPSQLEKRAEKREAGVDIIKQAIDSEYGPGMGDRVLQKIDADHGRDLSGGIRRSDLATIRQVAEQLALPERRDAALQDPDIAGFNGRMKHDVIQRFLERHFDVIASPEFWSDRTARANPDNIGGSLALAVLNRVQQNGTVTKKDIDDLQRAICPFVGPECPEAEPLPDTLAGPVTEQSLDALARIVYDRFMAPEAPVMINITQEQEARIGAAFSQPHSAGERIQALNSMLKAAFAVQAMAQGTVTNALRNIG